MNSIGQSSRDGDRGDGRSDSRSGDARGNEGRSDSRNDVPRNDSRNDIRNVTTGRRRSLASTAVQATNTPTQPAQANTKKSPSKSNPGTSAPCMPFHRGRLLGWFVLGVACVSHMTTTGMALANVILVKHMPPVFNETTTFKAAWVISISWGFGWLLAPVVAAMCLKFGLRSTCVLGGFVAALGHLFNSFSEDLIHVFLSFSLISAAGSCMCFVASSTFISSGSGRRCRIYHASQYLGTALFAYVIDAAIRCHGWIHGLQMSTVLVGINFLLGFFYGLSFARGDKKKEETTTETPVRLLEIIKSHILHDRLLFYWFLVEGVLNAGLRSPLLLMVTDSATRNVSLTSPVLGLVVVGLSSFVGTFLWALPRKCVPTSSLFFLQEQMIVLVIVIALIPMAQTPNAWLAIHGVYGLTFGGLNSFMTAQVRKLIIKEYRSHADSWALSARSVGVLFGPPLIVWLDGLAEDVRLGYYVSAGAVACAMVALLAIMRRLRIREIDIAYIEHSSMAIRPGVTVVPERGAAPSAPVRPVYSYANGAVVDGLEEQDVEDMVNTDLLWRSGVLADMDGPCSLHYLGDFYDQEGEQTPEGGRRKTLAEPSLPILPEVPSQENSSISKMDCSIHSGGRRESDLEALGFMGSDEVGTPNSGFAAIDEDSDRIGDIPAPRSPRSPGLGTSTPKFWARKGSLPERRSPVLKYTFRRRSADPEILKGMMYLPIPTQPRVEENFEINIVPPPKPHSSLTDESPITITKELPNNLPDVMEKLDPDDTVTFTETTV